ncbi:OmpA family protein [Legionella sp. CNM-4043-24]|uniref:OmpA family protein n=1 Tax=Legionella sp. CNM-4043-24 TaxID=3421646 RepID=UPI00403AF977
MHRLPSLSSASIWLTMLLVFPALTACHKQAPLPLEEESFRLPRNVAGASDPKVAAMIRQFNRTNTINIVTIGQDYLVSLPSQALFPDESPRITWKGYSCLNQVVAFLKQFRKISVTVTSYSSPYRSVAREQALTSARARAVGDYLWSQGIDSRFIFTDGAGSDKPVTAVTERGDKAPSSRIEITFRDAVLN